MQQASDVEKIYYYAWGKLETELEAFLKPATLHTTAKKIRSVPGMSVLRQLYHTFDTWQARKQFQSVSADVYHATSFILRNTHLPTVVTIHDLSFIHYPQFHPKRE